jgi:hypothetical protein
MKMEYTVVTSQKVDPGKSKDENLTIFLQKVNQLLNQGWELAGGISSILHGGNYYYIYTQALIKK